MSDIVVTDPGFDMKIAAVIEMEADGFFRLTPTGIKVPADSIDMAIKAGYLGPDEVIDPDAEQDFRTFWRMMRGAMT